MKSYLRFLSRNKLYTAIMAVGLCVSLAFVIIFTCYTRQQFAVCNHYPGSKDIYLLGMGGRTFSYETLAEEIENEIPGVEDAVLVQNYYNGIKYNGELSSEEGMLMLDKDFFDVFETRFLAGSPEVFNTAENALVTESFARRNGMEEVIGTRLIDGKKEFIIAGIIEDFNDSVFNNFEVILNGKLNAGKRSNQTTSSVMTFIKVSKGTDIKDLEANIENHVLKFMNHSSFRGAKPVTLIRLDELYFSEINDGMMGLKCEKIDKVFILSIVVIFLLISSIINYVNLNVASAERREKEMALRHILGADRRHVYFRVFAESLVFTALSFMAAIALSIGLSDKINDLLRPEIPLEISFTADYMTIYCLVILATSFICSLAVSLNVSRTKVTSSTRTRKPLSGLFMGLQFVMSFVMISVSLTMEAQMRHMVNRDMFANVDNLYRTMFSSTELKQKVKALPFIRNAGRSTGYPGYFGMLMGVDGGETYASIMYCDSIAFRLFGFDIIEDHRDGNPLGVWLTERAANHFNVDKENFTWKPLYGLSDKVSGIIKDTPTSSIVKKQWNGLGIVAVVKQEDVRWGGWILEMDETDENRHYMDSLTNVLYKNMSGREAFGCGFIKDLNRKEYDQTERDMRLIELFMFISIMLSCLAFFAISMHYSVNNAKPVSIHKVFGGSTSSELRRCLGKYFRIMLPALIIGIPPAWILCGRYLQQFSYRIDLKENIWIFLTSMVISIAISTAAVLWQTLRAARTNPAEALKKE